MNIGIDRETIVGNSSRQDFNATLTKRGERDLSRVQNEAHKKSYIQNLSA